MPIKLPLRALRSMSAVLVAGICTTLAAQTALPTPDIYTCTDAKGRKLTSDRPIAECMDRDQRELNPSGSVRRVLTPPPAPKSRAELLADEKTEADARLQKAEENRRDRALRLGYPDRASHDKARTAALQNKRNTIDGKLFFSIMAECYTQIF